MMDKARYGGQRTRHRQEKEAVHAYAACNVFSSCFAPTTSRCQNQGDTRYQSSDPCHCLGSCFEFHLTAFLIRPMASSTTVGNTTGRWARSRISRIAAPSGLRDRGRLNSQSLQVQ